jgi:hypothetical protein
MDEEGGVLGNLPRSRPGRRSEKRDSTRPGEGAAGAGKASARAAKAGPRPAKTSARAAETAERRSAKAARPSGQAARRPEPPQRPADGGPDPVGDAVRMAAGVAGLGLKVANGVTREVLRRLPRP